MAHKVAKVLTSDDGEPRQKELQVWHLLEYYGDGPRTFCEGEVLGFGESSCDYTEKLVERAGITCDKCIERIKKIKAIKL